MSAGITPRIKLLESKMSVIDDVIHDVAELPDRTSPADFPDAMLVTADELRCILRRRPTPELDLLEWAVEQWNAQVKERPMVNVYRRTLDSVWRQVIAKAGGDPDALVGPAHDDL